MKKILILGVTGMLGNALKLYLSKIKDIDLYYTARVSSFAKIKVFNTEVGLTFDFLIIHQVRFLLKIADGSR